LEEFKKRQKSSKKTEKDSESLAQESVSDKENIVTETLARIHANQGNIDKAIEVYEQLRLQYPKKSRYFVNKIKELKDKK
jgi:pentatricopeptide repeat protein